MIRSQMYEAGMQWSSSGHWYWLSSHALLHTGPLQSKVAFRHVLDGEITTWITCLKRKLRNRANLMDHSIRRGSDFSGHFELPGSFYSVRSFVIITSD